MTRKLFSALAVLSLSMWIGTAHALLTFTDVSYTSNTLSFSVSGDMSGYATPAQQLLFTIAYEGDMWAGPATLTPNTWNRAVFTNLSLTNQGNTGYYDAGAFGYTFSQYGASLATGTVTNLPVIVTFDEARLNTSAVNPSVTFGWGGVTGFTVLDTVDLAPATYSVEGTVSGLTALGLVLQNNGGDDLDVFTNGNFLFSERLTDGSVYDVTVLANPPGQTCGVTNGSGTIATADVTNVAVTCVTDVIPTYSVGGIVSGLTGTGLELQNAGTDTLAITANGSFTFVTELTLGTSYVVAVSNQPTGQTCTISNGSGTISDQDITDVAVNCVNDPDPLYTINGVISGLGPISVTLRNNSTDDLLVYANGPFVFATALPEGSAYNVTVSVQPAGQICTVTNGFGTVADTDVLGIDVACADDVVPPIDPPTPAFPVPTLSQWALILLSMLLGLMVFSNRKRLF